MFAGITHAGKRNSVIGRLLMLAIWLPVLLGTALASVSASSPASAYPASVYVIPVKMTVQQGLAAFLDRALTEAEEAGASLVILDVDTPGGRLDSADQIATRIRSAKVPTVAFVSGKAASAGAYIALNAGGIAMAPGSSIGAAMMVNQLGEPVEDIKNLSFWRSQMSAAAELNGRNPAIALAMVDPSGELDLPEIGRKKEQGQILTLTFDEALKVGYSDVTAKTISEVMAWKGLEGVRVVEIEPTFAERAAQWLTSSGVSTLLLILGIAGIGIELIVPGFGLPGIVGVAAFALYFLGHYIAGIAGMESMIFFIAGIILLLLEMFIPSFGILGILGAAGLLYGIVSAAYDTGNAAQSLGIAAIVALAVIVVTAYVFRKRGIWNRFILKEQLTADMGFVPNEASREELVGKEGITKSPLRPAGVAEIDGKRVDVVSPGDFVERGKPIRVVAVDGTRILVEEIKSS